VIDPDDELEILLRMMRRRDHRGPHWATEYHGRRVETVENKFFEELDTDDDDVLQ
jgi:hypothetical protein